MQQLMSNIIANAIKFRQENIPPHIIINGEFVDAATIPDLSPDGSIKYFHLKISDKGIGFEPVYAEKIFDIFQRLHAQSEYEGTGIGLAICKKIAETHNGFIRATGEPGVGATFHIYLPVNNEHTEGR
jgi:signal transduction histidine kinase